MPKKAKKVPTPIPALKKPTPQLGRSLLLLRLGAGLIVAIVFFLTSFTLSRASFAPIALGDISISSTSSEQALKQKVTNAAAAYRIVLQYPDGSKKLPTLNEAGIVVDAAASAKDIQQYLNHHFWQRLAWWQPIQVRLTTKTDETKLQQFIKNNAVLVTTPPVNAALSADNGTAAITPEVVGKGSTVKSASHVIPEKVAVLAKQPLVLTPETLAPEISASDLNAAKTKLANLLAQTVQFSVSGKTVTASPTDIASWIEITPIAKDKTADVTINGGKVAAYIEQIAKSYTQPTRNRVVMDAPTGEVVLDPGSSGVDVTKKAETAAAATVAAQNGNGFAADLPVTSLAAKTVHIPVADKVLVVDTSAKRMYAYEKTNLMRTILVSAGAPGTPTVLGQFSIYAKYEKQDMRGGNADGSRYFQPDVPYVNYFHESYAIHGNYWRAKSYFGNINSSHGCVGISNPDDAWVYNWAPIGTPVVVHD